MCCWKRVFAITSAFSWQNSISLCPASFRTPRPNLCILLWPKLWIGWAQMRRVGFTLIHTCQICGPQPYLKMCVVREWPGATLSVLRHFLSLISSLWLVTQSSPTLCDAMNSSPPGFSVHGFLQGRILEWVVISFSS